MNLEREDSAHESVADNEVGVNNGNSDSSGDLVRKNESDGSVDIDQVKEMSDADRVGKRVQEKEVNSMPAMVAENSGLDSPSSPGTVKKGQGLRKWRRIKREVTKEGCVIVDSSKLSKRGFPNAGGLGKGMQFSSETRQRSDGSVSSTHAMVRRLGSSVDGFAVGASGPALGPFFATAAESENSDDHSSKSSTAASIPKMRNDGPVSAGQVNYRNKVANVSGKKFGSSVQKVPQDKAQTKISKKPRGEKVNIEKETSHSSMESDSRSINFVSMQGRRSVTSRRNGGSVNYSRSEDVSQEDLNAGSSCSVKEENSENQGCSTDQDDPIESTHMLQSVQEAIEKEIQKFREIGVEDSHVDDSSQEGCLPSELMFDSHVNGSYGDNSPRSLHTLESEVSSLKENVHLMEIKLEESTATLKMKEARIGELEGRLGSHTNREEMAKAHAMHNVDLTSELEALYKQKIEADIEYLTISKTIQDLRVASVDQISQLEEKIVSEQSQIMNKLIGAESKAVNLKRDAKSLEKHCEDIVIADETVKLQSSVCKYTTCFSIQLVMLVVMLIALLSQLSPHAPGVVPT
ncbi:hypothetical protein Leryth_005113 [Lithospermum erythrorhizon]|nr:hypothetical protein Leryth_005113 [Lithospermum erythrorhizon]